MSPTDRAFDVFGRLALLEQSSEGFAVQRVARFQFTDGELRLGHRIIPLMSNNLNRRGEAAFQLFGPSPARWSTSCDSLGLRQGLDGFVGTLQPAGDLQHVADLEGVLATGMTSSKTAEGGLLNALGLQPQPERDAQLTVAGLKPELPVFSGLPCRDLKADLQPFARIQQGGACP